jgi:hypothetical protein
MSRQSGAAWIIPAIAAALFASTAPGSATPIGSNILINGDAEAGIGSASGDDVEAIPGWSTTSNFTVVQYGAPAFPTAAVSTTIGGGANFFAGGLSTGLSTATQTLDVSDLAGVIDAGSLSATLSAFIGGFDGQDDDMTLTATFLDGSSTALGAVTIGPVTEADRAGDTTMLSRTGNAVVPVDTRSIDVEMVATRFQGSYDDGYADNLSLILSGSSPVTVPEPASVSLLLAGMAGILMLRRKKGAGSPS